jgi:hypothetical protein
MGNSPLKRLEVNRSMPSKSRVWEDGSVHPQLQAEKSQPAAERHWFLWIWSLKLPLTVMYDRLGSKKRAVASFEMHHSRRTADIFSDFSGHRCPQCRHVANSSQNRRLHS